MEANMRAIVTRWCGLGLFVFSLTCAAQTSAEPLDPARAPEAGKLQSTMHRRLPEQYIWSAQTDDPSAARYFRTVFSLRALPPRATLYLSGPRRVLAFVNGTQVGDFQAD